MGQIIVSGFHLAALFIVYNMTIVTYKLLQFSLEIQEK